MGKSHPPPSLADIDLQLCDIMDFLPDATFVIDKQSRVIVWNRAMAELSGIPAADMLGKDGSGYAFPFYNYRRPILIDFVGEPDEVVRRYYPDFVRSRDIISAEVFVPSLKEGGAYLWAFAKPLYDTAGEVIGAIESFRDITDHKNNENTILRQKRKLEEMNQSLSAKVRELEQANREYREINDRLENARKDYIEANNRLRESEEKFASIFQLSPVSTALSRLEDGCFVDVNDYFCTVSGYSREEIIGHSSEDLNMWISPEGRGFIFTKLTQEGRMLNEEVQLRDKSGNILDMYFSAERLKIGANEYLLTMSSDITDHKKAREIIRKQKEDLERINRELKQTLQELMRKNVQLDVSRQELVAANEKLRLSEEKFSKAFCLGPVIITISSVADGRYVEVSDYFLKTTGYAREEVIGRTAIELSVWNNEKDRKNIIEALQTTGVVRDRPLQFRSKHGDVFLMLYSAEIISIGEVPHIVSVAVDITERQKALEERERLENQLRQAQKMESVGRLAGGVAHDFNNLLTAIMGNTDMAMAVTEPGGKIQSKLEVIMKASESAADLTRQLLAFSRKQVIEPQVIDLNDIIRYMSKMLARMIGENIHLTTNIHVPVAKIMADPGQVEQVIVNLVVNARDAMPEGGRVIMEVGETEFDVAYCNRHPYVLPGTYISLSVSDTGMGMTDDVSRKIFEPFFTTKPLGKGTGLGLATVYGAVKQNNGSIEVYSAPGQGTSFKIYFPKVADQAEIAAADNMHDVVCGGSETILLVEDDSLVRDFALDALRRLGYHVIEAASAEEALSVSGAFGKEIHLLLSDVILPGMNGKALADALTILRPDMRVLFTSGYTGDIIAHHGILKEGIAFIEKPYTIGSLSKKIRKVFLSARK